MSEVQAYLFDWGDTLMVDLPGQPGKMCDWPKVQAVEGAFECLQHLSKQATIYIATGAQESTESDIQQAFARVGLAQFISGYFCYQNLGYQKGSAEFLHAILDKLQLPAKAVAMVGDTLEKDIKPALAAGIKAIWLNSSAHPDLPKVRQICCLSELTT